VPENLKRYYRAGDLRLIACSCYQRQPILGTPQRRDLFLSVLEQMRQAYRFVVLGYVVMPEHFHLLLSEPQLGTLHGFASGENRLCPESTIFPLLAKSARNGAPGFFRSFMRRSNSLSLISGASST